VAGLAVAGVRLAGARDVRHVRDQVRRSPRPAADLPVRGVRRSPAAQGLSQGEAPAAGAAPRPADQPDQGARRAPLMAARSSRSSASKPSNEPGRALKQLVLGRRDVQDLSDNEQELPSELMTVNMGPSHPAMHGTVRIVLTVDGERVVASDVQPGYLHRCFEKESEHATYTQVFPYTDRLNYVSPMINNVGWAMAVEKLMGLTGKLPRRAEYIRVIVSEMSRMTDHLTCVGASAMELGAFTPFLYLLKCREWLYELLEKVSGARLTHSYVRIGGVGKDLTPGFDA